MTDGLIRFIIMIRFVNIVRIPGKEVALEQTIGATELRRHLTDVLQAVREERAAYIVATFERSQAALINLEEYRQFRAFKQQREAFFDWLERSCGPKWDAEAQSEATRKCWRSSKRRGPKPNASLG